jgi:hypothetical protein
LNLYGFREFESPPLRQPAVHSCWPYIESIPAARTCHKAVAVDDASPEVLKTIGIK